MLGKGITTTILAIIVITAVGIFGFYSDLNFMKDNLEENESPIPMSSGTRANQTWIHEPSWWHTYGGAGNDFGYAATPTLDGLLITGSTSSSGEGWSDLYLVKTDFDGVEQWNRTYGGRVFDEGNDVQLLPSAGFVIAGTTSSYGAGGSNVWLLKIGASGNEFWNHTYGGALDERGLSVISDFNKGYAVAGETESYGAGGTDVWLIKTDSNGVEEWNRTFGGPGDEKCNEVHQLPTGEYIMVGETTSYGAGETDIWLVKADSDGNELWNVTFGGSGFDSGTDVWYESLEGFIISGWREGDDGRADMWLIKTNTTGVELWSEIYGGGIQDFGEAVFTFMDTKYTLLGSTGNYDGENFDVMLIKTDDNGTYEWHKRWGGKDYDFAEDLTLSPMGGYIVVGTTQSFGAGGSDVFMLSYDMNAPPEQEDQPPECTLTSPSENDTVEGGIQITGTADDPDSYYFLVFVKIDNSSWITASEDYNWAHYWNTSEVENGKHTIYARSFDGGQYSETVSVNVTVDNEIIIDGNGNGNGSGNGGGNGGGDGNGDGKGDEDKSEGGEWSWFAAIAVIIISIVVFLIVLVKVSAKKE
jgi:hypothetical protein